jgi:predicted ArsR family transcriptional regulator
MDHRQEAPDGVAALIAALDDPTRRALYRYVADASDAVGRDEAAAALRLPRATVAFHLDKLAEAGLVAIAFRRLNDRAGPGAGRPSKLYRVSESAVDLSIPPRRYMLAGEILTSALDAIRPSTAENAVRRAALAQGRTAIQSGGLEGAPAPTLLAALASLGYEPEEDARDGITLRNCPFHALVQQSEQRTCSMNQAFLEGVLEGVGDVRHRAELAPAPGQCCVRLTRVAPGTTVAA